MNSLMKIVAWILCKDGTNIHHYYLICVHIFEIFLSFQSWMFRDPKPTNHTVAHSWMWQNWIYNHFGFLHLLSGLLVRKSCFCSEDKVAASDASSSCTAIFWAIWSELHLTLAIYFELFTLGGDVYPSHPNHAVVIFIIYTNCEPAMMLFYLYNRISDAFRTIKREEGFSAFYRGIVPGFFLVCCLLFVFFLSILPP